MNMQYEEPAKLQKEFQRLEGLFEKIKNGEIYLRADYQVCAIISGLDPGYYLIYKDDSGIGKIYEQSAFLVCKCVCFAMYRQAMRLYALMKETKIFVYTEIYAYLDLKGLISKKIAEIDLKKLDAYEFYAVYCSAAKSERVQAVYDFLRKNLNKWDILIKAWRGLQAYLELPGLEECVRCAQETSGILEPVEMEEFLCLSEFWDSWILFLKKRCKTGDQIDAELLTEALKHCERNETLLEQARLCYKKDPSLYWTALRAKELRGDYAGQVAVGKEALEKLDANDPVRCAIALWTARAALYVKEYALAEDCCEQAVLSDLTPMNYLLASAVSPEPEKLKGIVAERLQRLCPKQGYYELNIVDADGRQVLTEHLAAIFKFFLGDFHVLIGLYERKEILQSDMECGIALMMLLFVKDRVWKEGCRYIADVLYEYVGIGAGRYVHVVKEEQAGSDVYAFQVCLLKWKGRQQTVPEPQAYLPRLEAWADRCIKENYGRQREEYKKAAGFAAALGEVKESLGEKDGKQHVLARYRTDFKKRTVEGEGFSREKAFDIYLKHFGMRQII